MDTRANRTTRTPRGWSGLQPEPKQTFAAAQRPPDEGPGWNSGKPSVTLMFPDERCQVWILPGVLHIPINVFSKLYIGFVTTTALGATATLPPLTRPSATLSPRHEGRGPG